MRVDLRIRNLDLGHFFVSLVAGLEGNQLRIGRKSDQHRAGVDDCAKLWLEVAMGAASTAANEKSPSKILFIFPLPLASFPVIPASAQ